MGLSDSIIVKIKPLNYQRPPPGNEQDILGYLRFHTLELPIPESLGLVNIGDVCYSFISFIPRGSGESMWKKFAFSQKERLKSDLAIRLS